MNGWLKLHRQMLEWEWFADSHTMHVFLYCLLKANFSDSRYKGIEVRRGELFTSTAKIAIETGISAKAVRIALDKLQSTGEIETQGASRGTKITICKYDQYQNEEPDKGQTEGQAKGKPKGKRGASERANEGQALYNKKERSIIIQEEEEFKNKEENTSGDFSPVLPHNSLIKIYIDWYEEKLQVKYKFSGGQDAKAIKEISKYIHGAIKQRQGREPTCNEIEYGFIHILKSWDMWDSFYQQQLKISQINSNLPNILANIKGIKNGQNNSTLNDDREYIKAAVAAINNQY